MKKINIFKLISNLISSVLSHPLNSDNKIQALKRIFRWKISSRTSFGPTQEPYEYLNKMIGINNLGNLIIPHQITISPTGESIRITNNLDVCNHIASEDEEGITVPSMSIDALCADKIPMLIKIDVEGFGLSVPESAKQTLANYDCEAVIVEINTNVTRYGSSPENIISFMKGFGYEMVRYDFKNRQLISLKNTNDDSDNTIFAKNRNKIEKRHKNATKFSIRNSNVWF